MFDFIGRFAPHLNKNTVSEAMMLKTQEEIDEMFEGVILPKK
jgi:LysR family cys regulon transcriptional activator